MNDTVVCFDDLPNGLVLDPGRVGSGFVWSSSETTQTISINQSGVYIVNITNNAGCSSIDRVKIQQDCPESVWLPNAFTPNGNSLNETWEIKGRNVSNIQVLVFNRWGEQIWKGNQLGDFWDGRYKEKFVQQDVYVYKLSYSYININEELIIKNRVGTVAVLK